MFKCKSFEQMRDKWNITETTEEEIIQLMQESEGRTISFINDLMKETDKKKKGRTEEETRQGHGHG